MYPFIAQLWNQHQSKENTNRKSAEKLMAMTHYPEELRDEMQHCYCNEQFNEVLQLACDYDVSRRNTPTECNKNKVVKRSLNMRWPDFWDVLKNIQTATEKHPLVQRLEGELVFEGKHNLASVQSDKISSSQLNFIKTHISKALKKLSGDLNYDNVAEVKQILKGIIDDTNYHSWNDK